MILFFALLLDWFFGDPQKIWKRLPHPVVIIGKGIDFLDKKFNSASLESAEARGRGIITLLILLVFAVSSGVILAILFEMAGVFGWILEVLLVSIFLAQKSLKDHVADVAASLRLEGEEGGRRAVSKIVGRDTAKLGKSDICRAAIESLAENFSDGVVAPVLWYLIAGLPGLIAYKVINTADSMIGHKNRRYQNFGRATALVDDVVNWPAARISVVLIAGASLITGGVKQALHTISQTLQGASTHRSPNAGWPETAMAASLGISLGGPRQYGDAEVYETMLNTPYRAEATPRDIDKALNIFLKSCALLWFTVLIISL